MSSEFHETLTDAEKLKIVSDFVLHAPPGEFKEVLNDVRLLLNNDTLLKEQASSIFSRYSKDQLTPVIVEGSEYPTLVSEYNDVGGGRYVDPRTKQTFKYDTLREEASDYASWSPDSLVEPWRLALDSSWSNYCKEHYFNGVHSVFASNNSGQICLTACIEDHQFQPKNYWNGRWRSIWSLVFNPSDAQTELKGLFKVQVHYYEDGNVQLVSYKEVKETVTISSEEQLAKEIIGIIEEAENDYQIAISENYQTMSETTFKALRRPLPVTRSKIEWNKIMSYKIGSELKQQ